MGSALKKKTDYQLIFPSISPTILRTRHHRKFNRRTLPLLHFRWSAKLIEFTYFDLFLMKYHIPILLVIPATKEDTIIDTCKRANFMTVQRLRTIA